VSGRKEIAKVKSINETEKINKDNSKVDVHKTYEKGK
jgi:hypothetical protein